MTVRRPLVVDDNGNKSECQDADQIDIFFVQTTTPGTPTQNPALWLQTGQFADPTIVVPWVFN